MLSSFWDKILQYLGNIDVILVDIKWIHPPPSFTGAKVLPFTFTPLAQVGASNFGGLKTQDIYG